MGKRDDDNNKSYEADFEWILINTDAQGSEDKKPQETSSKLRRKLKENPLVPIGCLITTGVLVMGLRSFLRGDPVRSQKFMRYRVLAQGTTVALLLLGVLASAFVKK